MDGRASTQDPDPGRRGQTLGADALAREFGPRGGLSHRGVAALHRALSAHEGDRRVSTLFRRWRILFGETCGCDLLSPGAELRSLACDHGVDAGRPVHLLFALHTYYALVMKLLAAHVASFHLRPGAWPLAAMREAPSVSALARCLQELEQGGLFQQLGVTNFIEGDLFAWYLSAWSEELADTLREVAARLQSYNPGSPRDDPGRGRDLLKELHHQLFPARLRRALGEFYTPDWLAELTMDRAGYDGDPRKRLLDPACGSGTFLLLALARIRGWLERSSDRPGEVARLATTNLIGFDLNPLAVLAARTNFLVQFLDLFGCQGEMKIPIYLSDSVLAPLAQDGSCRLENAPAPAFSGKKQVDLVVGNPPWINWESLPGHMDASGEPGYRQQVAEVFKRYGLFSLSGAEARLGGSKKDLSMLFVYAAVDRFLKPGGKLAFVITQTVFKTRGAGQGFRRFEYEERTGRRSKRQIRVLTVDDLSSFQPFEGPTNRTAVLVCTKSNRRTAYPLPYVVWRKVKRGRIGQQESLQTVKSQTVRETLCAVPVNPADRTSPWLTAPEAVLPALRKVMGQSAYRGYEGVNTGGLNGCYWLEVLRRFTGGLLVQNMHNVGKIEVSRVCRTIEATLVFQLLRGRDVGHWRATPSASILLAQDPQVRAGLPEEQMRARWPRTFAYLKEFESQLRQRALFRKYFDESDPFYSMYNVGPYTMDPWKVIWREQGFQAAVVGPDADGRPVVPDHKLMLVACGRKVLEAHFLCALLSSSPARMVVTSHVLAVSTSTHLLDFIAIPRYRSQSRLHAALARLSRRAHLAAARGRPDEVAELESQIDRFAARLWGLSEAELLATQAALGGRAARHTWPVSP